MAIAVCALALVGCWRVRVRALVLAQNAEAWARAAGNPNDPRERALGAGALADEGEILRTGGDRNFPRFPPEIIQGNAGSNLDDDDDTVADAPDSPEPLALSLLPGMDVALEPGSALEIQRLRIEKRVDKITAREAAVAFRQGALLVSLAAPEGAALSSLVVATTVGTVRSGAGSLFGIWGEDNGARIRVVCAGGEVDWAGQPVAPGTAVDAVVPRQTAAAPAFTTVDAVADAVAQRQIARLRAAERNLHRLELRRQEAPPAWRR